MLNNQINETNKTNETNKQINNDVYSFNITNEKKIVTNLSDKTKIRLLTCLNLLQCSEL